MRNVLDWRDMDKMNAHLHTRRYRSNELAKRDSKELHEDNDHKLESCPIPAGGALPKAYGIYLKNKLAGRSTSCPVTYCKNPI
jgi:hypothetical protein